MTRRPAKPAIVIDEAAFDLPAWYDPELHLHGSDGILERATGHYLAEDGLPASPAIRARLAAEADAPAEAGETAATVTQTDAGTAGNDTAQES